MTRPAWPSVAVGDHATLLGQSVLQGIWCAQESTCDCRDGTSCDFFLNILIHTNYVEQKKKVVGVNLKKNHILFFNKEGFGECAYEPGGVQYFQQG